MKSVVSEELIAVALLNAEGKAIAGENLSQLMPNIENLIASKSGENNSNVLKAGIYSVNASDSINVHSNINDGFMLAALVSGEYLTSHIGTVFAEAYFSLAAIGIICLLLIRMVMKLTYIPLHRLAYKVAPESKAASDFDWYMNGTNVDAEHRTLIAAGCFNECEDLDDVLAINFPWPDPEKYIDPEQCRKNVEEAPADKVVMGMMWACHFQDTCAAFGMQEALMNMVTEPKMVHYIDDKIVAFYEKAMKIFLEATKGKVHAILIGDDIGSQRGLMISPKLVTEFVIPGAKRLIDLAHSYGVKVLYHSCGSIVEIIPQLIEAGVDIIHPIQALATGMEPQNLKNLFGDQVAFCGGVDTQELLPNGTPEQVMTKVNELRTIFPTGLIISPSHEAIQSDVPPQNIEAMFEETNKIY